ncbi:unnamed protein product [Coffea canephora]|uniref:DH200=94 genomic scaffold, scaffold_6482 n=1 Tax=Coffea canephora TaxID=49390 RepID=A0A068VLW2_COFCA|nr:unnamed protein product [Coffea canephora]
MFLLVKLRCSHFNRWHLNMCFRDISNNRLAGTVRATNKTGLAITTVVQDPKAHY